MLKTTQKGFAALEVILVLVAVVGIGGTGYYVWHSNRQAKATLESASKVTKGSQSNEVTNKYLVIKKWNVKIPYQSSDTLTYAFQDTAYNNVKIISHELALKYRCTTGGAGQISRQQPGEVTDAFSGGTTAEDAKKDPSNYTFLAGYYYIFYHDQFACSSMVKAQAQSRANNFTQQVLPSVMPITK